MVSAEAEAGKYFSLLSAFFMTISGSTESFRLCDSEDIDLFAQKTPCISWAGEVHTLSLSGGNVSNGRRAADTFFQVIEWLEMKEMSLFLCCIRPHQIFVSFCAHLSSALLAPKVKSARFPLEERFHSEMLVTQILPQEEFIGGSGLPSSSPGLA